MPCPGDQQWTLCECLLYRNRNLTVFTSVSTLSTQQAWLSDPVPSRCNHLEPTSVILAANFPRNYQQTLSLRHELIFPTPAKVVDQLCGSVTACAILRKNISHSTLALLPPHCCLDREWQVFSCASLEASFSADKDLNSCCRWGLGTFTDVVEATTCCWFFWDFSLCLLWWSYLLGLLHLVSQWENTFCWEVICCFSGTVYNKKKKKKLVHSNSLNWFHLFFPLPWLS